MQIAVVGRENNKDGNMSDGAIESDDDSEDEVGGPEEELAYMEHDPN